MILPGGESTTMLKFLQEEGLEAAAARFAAPAAAHFLAPARARFCWRAKCALRRKSRWASPIW